jgi:hypothetical protein
VLLKVYNHYLKAEKIEIVLFIANNP